jgi:hypothetical protein
MTWKNQIKKDAEDDRNFKIISPLLEKIENYIKRTNPADYILEAFKSLEFVLMSDIGYTGQYEDDGATPMEDAMYRQKESR